MAQLTDLQLGKGGARTLKVAAYCRISFDEELANEGSYAAQKAFFKTEIDEHPDWIYAGVYGDYNRSGTQIKGRFGFQTMLEKAKAGKIDYILTKSISRFARSTADTLHAVRELHSAGVGIYFLEQNLDTGAGMGELILSILASVAEMESKSISENTRMVFEAMRARGTPLQPARYGYRKEGVFWKVVPSEAHIVQMGFLLASQGFSFKQIAVRLNSIEPTDRDWDTHMVKGMLQSETYIGDIETNKTARVWDERGKRQVKNDGLVDSYYIRDHHDPLVGRELFNAINTRIRNREFAGQAAAKTCEELRWLAARDPLIKGLAFPEQRPAAAS